MNQPDSEHLSHLQHLQHYQALLRVVQRITTQRDTLRLCEVIAEEARALSGAAGALVYLLADSSLAAEGSLPADGSLSAEGSLPAEGSLSAEGSLPADGPLVADSTLLADDARLAEGVGTQAPRLRCVILRWPARALCQGGDGHGTVAVPEVPLDAPGSAVAQAARSGRAVASAPLPEPVAGVLAQSSLALPLLDHDQQVLGVLQLLDAVPDAAGAEASQLLGGLISYAATALHNVLLAEELEQLLDAFIRVIARAIDEKSSHTSGHCQRVPLLTELIAQAACDDATVFGDFDLSDDEWYELRVAAWLHDCGKLTTPDSVLDKSTKLHTLHDRIEEIAARYAVLRAVRQGECAAAVAAQPEQAGRHRQALAMELAALDDELAFLRHANIGSERMADADQARVRQIALRQWPDAGGRLQPLLAEDEVAALCVVRGTLTKEERDIINNHVQVTLDMLESLPFPRKLRRVPEYAGGHHERIDGSGFPRGLTGEQMSLPARMLAIADVFEALTAHDRPYKPPMKISQALGILKQMRDARHIDADLYELFVRERVWETYARQVLAPTQLDVTDADIFL